MQVTGLLHGSRLLKHVDFPCPEVLGPGASEDDIQALIERHGLVFVKPVFKGGVGKKGKAGLVAKVRDLEVGAGRKGTALLRKAPAWQCHRKGQWRDIRGGGAG